MEPEAEALRLSAMIAFCVGAYLIVLSVDNFNQQKTPTRIGEAQCTWWSANVQGCGKKTRSLSQMTAPSQGLAFNL